MPSNRFYPLPLKNLYRLSVSLGPDPSPEEVMGKLRLRSKRTASQYVKTLAWISKRVRGAATLDDFLQEIASFLADEFGLREALEALSKDMIPLTPSSLSSILRRNGVKVTNTEARAIISWLKQAGALKERKVPVLVLTLEDRVLEEIRGRGSVTYGTLRKAFGDEVRDVIISLWRRGLISVPALDKHRDVLMEAEDLDRLPADLKGRIFATWQDRITGETYSELVIPARARIEARWSL